ncbi:qcr9 subunit 9 of the ubiquinol cytochrome-c reductase complex [Neurospora sp. IMI 360204]|nr:qcr9 subunit 9 of the ubiquinol cytochrome-c reductase complex [Neurospora sp. IMI 360204]
MLTTPRTPIGPAPAPAPSPGPDPIRTPIANLHPSLIFRNNTAFIGAVFVGAFAFELAYDNGMDKVWDKINKGRQWKDIRHKYVQDEE